MEFWNINREIESIFDWLSGFLFIIENFSLIKVSVIIETL